MARREGETGVHVCDKCLADEEGEFVEEEREAPRKYGEGETDKDCEREGSRLVASDSRSSSSSSWSSSASNPRDREVEGPGRS